jgi:Cd2+/Zn2+-exporting ATPase
MSDDAHRNEPPPDGTSSDRQPPGDDACADGSCGAGTDNANGEHADTDHVRDNDADASVAAGDDGDGAQRLSVPGMDCPSCAETVTRSLDGVEGVAAVDTRPATGTVVVEGDADPDAVRERVEGAGYEVTGTEDAAGVDEPAAVWRSSRALRTYAGAVLLLAGLALPFLPVPNPVLGRAPAPLSYDVLLADLVLAGGAAVAGVDILRGGVRSARVGNLDIQVLMSVGILGALAVGLPFEAATLATLYSVAELLERYSMDRARDSLRELVELAPETATVRRDGGERVVPVEDVRVGEVVVVRPGDRVPVDGEVVEGTSAVDESPVTGESVPVDKVVGDEVYAGSVAAEGYLEVEATAPAGESTLARVIDLVADAEAGKTDHERFVDRFARYYTPVVVAGAILTAFGPPLFGAPFEEWFRRGLTLLVVACPCAFVISTPVSVVSAVTAAARNGVLVKGGEHLEAAGSVETVAFDKTGTLTTGELTVTDVVPLAADDEADVLACARALESRSEHPVAAAVVEHAERVLGAADDTGPASGAPGPTVTDFQNLPGKGVRAELDGVTHYAGKPGLFAELGFDLEHAHLGGGHGPGAGSGVRTDGGRAGPEAHTGAGTGTGTSTGAGAGSGAGSATGLVPESAACDHEPGAYLDLATDVLPRLREAGKTAVLIGTAERIEGVIGVADAVRPESRAVVRQLRAAGLEVAMLTGDDERTARVVAEAVGIDSDMVHADLLPEEKVAAVERLRERGGVAMVGDGVNDAPALAAATIGVAMGAAGTGAAIETADAALLSDDVSRVPYLFELARRTDGVIRTNIWGSLGVKALLAIGAPLGYVSVLVAVVVGDMGMSLAVTGNAMRLARLEPEAVDGDAGAGAADA